MAIAEFALEMVQLNGLFTRNDEPEYFQLKFLKFEIALDLHNVRATDLVS